MNELTEEQSVALASTNWWETKSDRDIVGFQLFQRRLCMPFSRFHEAIEKALGRPVFTHEFGLNLEGIKAEFLGVKQAPSFQEILELVPEAKRMVVIVP